MRGYLSRIGRDESGAILPIAAGALAMMLVLGALVIDVANWYEHGKTLQTRVDASVLAAGQRWAYPCDASVNANIEATAREFVGSHVRHPGDTLVTAPYNNLITTTDPQNVHVVFNSLQYFGDGGLDYTDRVNPNDAVTGQPCTREYLDAKITEMNIDGFFGKFAGLSFLPSLKKKARVAPFEVESLEGILPIGVKAFDVRSAAVLFMNQADLNGAPVDKKYLVKDPDGDSPDSDLIADIPGFVRWSNEADPATDPTASAATGITVPATGLSAVIVLSSRPRCGDPNVVPPCLDLSGTTASAICNQGDTECFDKTVSGTTQTVRAGLSHIAAYNASPGAPTVTQPPVLGDVYLEPGPGPSGCRTGTFTYGDAPCSIRLVADIRFAQGALPTGRPDGEVEFRAHDALNWCGNNGCLLTRDVSTGRWVTTIAVPALADDALEGRNPIRLWWAFGEGTVGAETCPASPGQGGNPQCDGGFGSNGIGYLGDYATGDPVHRTFTSNELLSGPVEAMRVWRNTGSGFFTNTSGTESSSSAAALSTTDLFVDIFLGSVVATSPNDPPIALRITGSQNGSIDCDPNYPQFSDEFVNGCRPRYTTNTTNTCPDYNVLWTTPQPWSCVKTQTGVALGQVAQALKDRVLEGGNGCPSDNDGIPGNFRRGWNWWNNGLGTGSNPPNPSGTMFPNFDPTDPRLVTLFVTPFGSFQGSGNAIFPISGFGAFYITGWAITGGEQDPCPDADAAPEKFLIGHFIKDVLISGATPSQNKCNPASLTPCVIALVE